MVKKIVRNSMILPMFKNYKYVIVLIFKVRILLFIEILVNLNKIPSPKKQLKSLQEEER